MEELEDAQRTHEEKVESILHRDYPSSTIDVPSLAKDHATTILFVKTAEKAKSLLQELYPTGLQQEEIVYSSLEAASDLSRKSMHLSERSIRWWKVHCFQIHFLSVFQ